MEKTTKRVLGVLAALLMLSTVLVGVAAAAAGPTTLTFEIYDESGGTWTDIPMLIPAVPAEGSFTFNVSTNHITVSINDGLVWSCELTRTGGTPDGTYYGLSLNDVPAEVWVDLSKSSSGSESLKYTPEDDTENTHVVVFVSNKEEHNPLTTLEFTKKETEFEVQEGEQLVLSYTYSSKSGGTPYAVDKIFVGSENDEIVKVELDPENKNVIVTGVMADKDPVYIGLGCLAGYDAGDVKAITVIAAGEGPVITFHANDESEPETTREQSVESGVKTPLDPNEFTYSGHKFLTWNTEEKGTGITYVDEQEVNLTADLDLYAQWISEEDEGTVVSLTKGDEADYEFSVPPKVELNKKLNGMVAGAVEIIVNKPLGKEGTYVNLLLTSDADEVPKDFSTFHVGNPKVEGGFATYTMTTYSDAKLTTKEHDIYGAQRSGMGTNNNSVMTLSGVTPDTSTKYIGFTTASLPSITGTYYGSLTFDAELVSPK